MSTHNVHEELKRASGGGWTGIEKYYDTSGNIILSWGSTIPVAGTTGYALRSIFVREASAVGLEAVHCNYGTTTSCKFLPYAGLANRLTDSVATPVTVAITDAGMTYIADVADCVFNLPDVTTAPAGLTYTFNVNTLSTVTGCSISPAATDKIQGNGLTKADDADLVNTALTDAGGDFVTVVSDGVNGWWITASRGTWA